MKAILKLKKDKDNVKGYGIVSGTGIKVFHDGTKEALGGVIHEYIRRGERMDRNSDILPVSKI